jgi:hypothetical protein
MLCWIAHNPTELRVALTKLGELRFFDGEMEVSNSEQLLFRVSAIIPLETRTSSLSFRSSELSQPSEVFSP